MPEPIFSADEVAALLERAAELQREGKKYSKETGLTLSELETIAKESGIDPSHIREAAFELAQPRRAPVQKSTGMGNQVIIERTVRAELTPELIEDVVSELRTRYDSGYAGTYGDGVTYGASRLEYIGRSVEWIHTDMMGYERRVRLQPRGDQLRIRMSAPNGWSTPQIESAIYSTGAALPAGVLGGAVGGLGWMWALVIAAVAFSISFGFITSRLIKSRQKRQRQTQETVDWIAEYALSMAGTNNTSAGTISLPAQDEFGVQDEHTHFRSSRTRS